MATNSGNGHIELPPPPPRERPTDRGGQVPDGWEDLFIEALKKTYLPSDAAKVAGVSRAFVYKHRKRDEGFAERWKHAVEEQTEILEQIAVKRAAESSDTLMIFLLKARKPDIYRENVHHEHQHAVTGQVSILAGAQPIEIEAAKRREAARMLLAGEDDVIEGTAEDIEEDAAA